LWVTYRLFWSIFEIIITIPAKPEPDSWFTSEGVDPSWSALLRDMEGQFGKEVVAREMEYIKFFARSYPERQKVPAKRSKPPPPPLPHTWSRNGAPAPPPSTPTSRTQAPQVVLHTPISPVEGEQSRRCPPLPRPQRPTPLAHGPLPPAGRSLRPQSGGPPLPRETEPRQTTAEIPYSHPRYSSVFRSTCSPCVFGSASDYIGNPLLRPFYLIQFHMIGQFLHPSFRPMLLHLRTARAHSFCQKNLTGANLWTLLHQHLKLFARMRKNPTQTKRCNFHPKALSKAPPPAPRGS